MRRIADRRPPPSPFARRQPTLLAMVDDPFVGLGREQGGKIVPQGGDFREQGGIAPASLDGAAAKRAGLGRSEEHTSELQSLMRISYAVFCLKKTRKYNTSHY